MYHQLERYIRLLTDEQCVKNGQVAISCQNDTVYSLGPPDLSLIANQILQKLDCAAIIVAEPLHPFPAFLLHRTAPGPLVPRDSESRSSLHDIPLVCFCQDRSFLVDRICNALNKRKGCIVEGIGIISQGTLTVEQAYIAWSSLSHATTIKYFEDLLVTGPLMPGEAHAIKYYIRNYLTPFTSTEYSLFSLSPVTPDEVISEMNTAGQATVRLGLVDSFFGNASCLLNNTLYISQTSARLDELSNQIDVVPFDRSSTAGITASSELPAHRAIGLATGSKVILHGHPRFPVIMSFFADSDGGSTISWLGELPVVGGEGGVGGLADSLPQAFCQTGTKAVIVRGHGVFVISTDSFGEALASLVYVEQRCRDMYFTKLNERYQI